MAGLIDRNAIQKNYSYIVERINLTAKKFGRESKDIKLVVVTKTNPTDMIQAVIDAGATDLGENYVDEAIPKIKELHETPQLQWHMIGHIQRRKAYDVCSNFNFVHSLDSTKLAEKLNGYALELNKILPAYLELNVGGEASKTGWDIVREENWINALPEIERILTMPNLNLLGLMAIPPYSADPEDSRPYYQRLRKFQNYVIDRLQIQHFNELSMGMSSDFEVAISEGSTCLRIGQAILGPRQYS